MQENPEIWTEELKRDIYLTCATIVDHEDAFIDLAFEQGAVEGLTAREVKEYIRYIADRRLMQLGLNQLYHVAKNPLPWLDEMLNAVEHANFFENRATEYSKASTTGTWEEAFSALRRLWTQRWRPPVPSKLTMICPTARQALSDRRMSHIFADRECQMARIWGAKAGDYTGVYARRATDMVHALCCTIVQSDLNGTGEWGRRQGTCEPGEEAGGRETAARRDAPLYASPIGQDSDRLPSRLRPGRLRGGRAVAAHPGDDADPRPLTPDGTRRRNMESLVAAHERLWHLRHPHTDDDNV